MTTKPTLSEERISLVCDFLCSKKYEKNGWINDGLLLSIDEAEYFLDFLERMQYESIGRMFASKILTLYEYRGAEHAKELEDKAAEERRELMRDIARGI